jgi:hypothetical protein
VKPPSRYSRRNKVWVGPGANEYVSKDDGYCVDHIPRTSCAFPGCESRSLVLSAKLLCKKHSYY